MVAEENLGVIVDLGGSEEILESVVDVHGEGERKKEED